MVHKPKSPLDDGSLSSGCLKFCAAAFFGLFVDFIVFVIAVKYRGAEMSRDIWIVMVAIPVIWGVLGVFFLEKMLDSARNIFEEYFK